MRKMRQFCTAAFLAMVLTISAFAGEIQLPSVTNPPPQQSTSAGDIQMPSASAAGQTETPLVSDIGSLTETALTLMVNVLSVF